MQGGTTRRDDDDEEGPVGVGVGNGVDRRVERRRVQKTRRCNTLESIKGTATITQGRSKSTAKREQRELPTLPQRHTPSRRINRQRHVKARRRATARQSKGCSTRLHPHHHSTAPVSSKRFLPLNADALADDMALRYPNDLRSSTSVTCKAARSDGLETRPSTFDSVQGPESGGGQRGLARLRRRCFQRSKKATYNCWSGFVKRRRTRR